MPHGYFVSDPMFVQVVYRELVKDLNIFSLCKILLPLVEGYHHAFGFLLWFSFISLIYKMMMTATPDSHCEMGHCGKRALYGPSCFRGTQ